MKVKEILSQYRNDFTAMMVCEHCGKEAKNSCGYFDDNYFDNVIPAMHCCSCGRKRNGDMKDEAKPSK